MRTLETLIPIALAIYILWPLTVNKRPTAVNLLPALAIVLLAIHAIVEGLRWQMVPLYALSVIAILTSIPAFSKKQTGSDKSAQPLRVIISLGLLAVATALPILLPVPAIPAPSGPYQVGTRIYELTDEARKEIYSGKDEARRFVIQVWYPAEINEMDERAPWMASAEIFAPAIASYIDMPAFFLDHLALVKIPAYKEATIAPTDEGYPVILFSHGWNGFNAQNTGQALELASHGYVVVGVQHTYGAVVTVFEDGTIAQNNPKALPSGAPDDEYDKAAHLLSDQWAGDMGYALDFLDNENNNANSPFHDSLDLSLIGVYGHSTGGGAAIQFCGTDTRCKTLLGQDPFMRPVAYEIMEDGITQPSFFMFSQVWADNSDSLNNRLFRPFYANSTDAYGAVYIEGSAHYDFADLPLLSPLTPQLGLKGPINGKRVTDIVNDYLLSFFDMALKGIPTELFEISNRYPEINLMFQ
jgi:predicted dienelactone hydrolase